MSKTLKISRKSPNGFMVYRSRMKSVRGITMAQLSREAARNWLKFPETVKRRYFHLAKEEQVKLETAKGKNSNTVKTFELGETFSFVIETPKPQPEDSDDWL